MIKLDNFANCPVNPRYYRIIESCFLTDFGIRFHRNVLTEL
jgi:hypothetical protein